VDGRKEVSCQRINVDPRTINKLRQDAREENDAGEVTSLGIAAMPLGRLPTGVARKFFQGGKKQIQRVFSPFLFLSFSFFSFFSLSLPPFFLFSFPFS